jgi:hypothetical protein
VRILLKAVILIACLIGITAIGSFALTGSRNELLRYSEDLLAVFALIVLVVVVSVPRLASRFLVLPNRAIVVVGTLVFGLEELYSNLARVFHYPFHEITSSVAFSVLLFSFGYLGIQIALASEHRLLSIENELAIAREIQDHRGPWTRLTDLQDDCSDVEQIANRILAHMSVCAMKQSD